MTTALVDKAAEKEAKKEAIKARTTDMEKREKVLNEGKTGKGTRTMLGMTRGKGSTEVQYEAFDESQPDTLPKTVSECFTLMDIGDNEPLAVSYLIDGFNSASYQTASDPTNEFVDPSWTPEVQKQFRLVVRNYSQATGVSIEDAVALIKPGIVASQKSK